MMRRVPLFGLGLLPVVQFVEDDQGWTLPSEIVVGGVPVFCAGGFSSLSVAIPGSFFFFFLPG